MKEWLVVTDLSSDWIKMAKEAAISQLSLALVAKKNVRLR